MTISSRTPDGQPEHCPMCGSEILVHPCFPRGDACCPKCGSLVWVAQFLLGDFVQPTSEDVIVANLEARSATEAIRQTFSLFCSRGIVAAPSATPILQQLWRREELGSTGIGNGIGVPHVQHPAVSRLSVAIGLFRRGVEFGSIDGGNVHTVILLLAPPELGTAMRQTMGRLAAQHGLTP